MAPVPKTIPALLNVARILAVRPGFDVQTVLYLLAAIPTDTLDPQILGAITHARMVAKAIQNGSDIQTARARSALRRLNVLLEQHVTQLRTN